MKVVAYEGVVENGCVHLPADAHLPEKAKVYIIVPGNGEAPRTFHIRSPRLANPEELKILSRRFFRKAPMPAFDLAPCPPSKNI